MRGFIPNAITLSNLICGCLAIYTVSHGLGLHLAALFIVLAAGFDFFDGLVARALGVAGDLGKQLDSLADVVSFGVAPAFILQALWAKPGFEFENGLSFHPSFIAFFFAACAAYRLAKFNIDPSQETGFKGLPTPAASLFVISIPLILHFEPDSFLSPILDWESLYPVLTVALGFAMVGNFPLLALKFKGLDIKENWSRYLVILSGLILGVIFHFTAIPIVLLLYLLISIIAKPKAHDLQS